MMSSTAAAILIENPWNLQSKPEKILDRRFDTLLQLSIQLSTFRKVRIMHVIFEFSSDTRPILAALCSDDITPTVDR